MSQKVKETHLVQITFSLVMSLAAEANNLLKQAMLSKLKEQTVPQKLGLERALIKNAICDINSVEVREFSNWATISY